MEKISLNLFNKSMAQSLNNNYNQILSMGFQEMPKTPGQLLEFQNSLVSAKDKTLFLFALGLNANQLQSDTVRKFVEDLSGQHVNELA